MLTTEELMDPRREIETCILCNSDDIRVRYDQHHFVKSFCCFRCGLHFERDRGHPYSVAFLPKEDRNMGKYCEVAAREYKQPGGQCVREECIHYDDLICYRLGAKGCTKKFNEACPPEIHHA